MSRRVHRRCRGRWRASWRGSSGSTTWPGRCPRSPAPSSPAALARRARAVPGLEPHAGPSPCAAAQAHGTTATDLAQAYSMSSLYSTDEGQGVTVGIYELEPYLPGDIGAFEACYSPSPSPLITPVSVDGAGANSGPGSGESALDIEMVVGLAPQANIDVYVGRNFGVGPLDVYSAMVNQDEAQVLSTSWGECEPVAGTAQIEVEANLLRQAAAQGQTFTAAAGDEGSEDCNLPGLSNDTSPPGGRPGQPALGDGGGRDGPRLLRASAGGDGVEHRHLRGDGGRGDLDPVDDARVAARARRRERLHQGERLVHRCLAVPARARDRGPSRAGRCPTSPPTVTRRRGTPCSAPAARGGGSSSAAPAWALRCGPRWRPWPTSRWPRRRDGSGCSIPLSTRPAAWPRRPSTTSGRATTSRSGPRRAIRRGPQVVRTTRPRVVTTWPAGWAPR